MRVLVTGAGGFVGSHLVDSQLAQGNTVRAVDLHVDALRHAAGHPNLELLVGDLANANLLPVLMQEVDVVYHLASAHLDVTRPDSYYHLINVTATEALLKAARAAGVKRFVHCSTNGVLGDIQRLPADENAPCRPTNIYERTKLLGELAAVRFHRDTGFPVVVARPAWVYGPRCSRTARLLRTIRKGRFVMFGSGKTLRHPIYVADAVSGLELCAARGVPGQIYFLAGERAVSLNELVRTMADVQGVRRPFVHLPLAAGLAAVYGAQKVYGARGQRPPVSRRTLDFYIKNNAYDTSKARRELGFTPQVDLPGGLQRTLAAAQESLNMENNMQNTVQAVHDYWNTHTLGFQYVTDRSIAPGTPEFFAHIRPWMNPYKFPWIMARIEREAALLKGKHLLEIGCGMGYDSLEFLKRGVRVTATDLTPNAVAMTLRHFEVEGVHAEEVRTANALELPFADNTFDAVWSNGVLHATGNTERAIQEARRVLKPGGRAIISHFYRKPSWMDLIHRYGRENIEYKEEDPPVNEFYTEAEILAMFKGFEVVEAVQEHHRLLPVRRDGVKAALYHHGLRPVYNLLPEKLAKKYAYKLSVTAIKV